MKRERMRKLCLVALGVFLWCWLMFGVIPRGEIERTVEVLIPPGDVPVDSKLLSLYLEDKTQFKPIGLDQYLVDSPQAVSRYWFAQSGSERFATVTYLAESREGQYSVAFKEYDLPEVGFYAIAAAHLEDRQLVLKTRTGFVEMLEMGVVLGVMVSVILWGLRGCVRWLFARPPVEDPSED